MSRKVLSKNDELFRGDCLVSKNGKWKVTFQVKFSALKTFIRMCVKCALIICKITSFMKYTF